MRGIAFWGTTAGISESMKEREIRVLCGKVDGAGEQTGVYVPLSTVPEHLRGTERLGASGMI